MLSSMKKYYVRTLAVIFITIAIFYIIFRKIDIYLVIGVLSHANMFYLLIAIFLLIAIILFEVKRWQTVLSAMGYTVSFSRSFNVLMGSLPLSSITPSKSGDLIRAYYMKDEIPVIKTIGSVLTERVFDLFALIIFSLIGLLFLQKFEFAGIAIIVLLAISVIFFLPNIHSDIPANGSWKYKLYNIMLSMKTLTKNKKAFSYVMLYSLLNWFLSIMQTVMFFYAIGVIIPLSITMANIPIAIFIGLMPVTLGGMGTRDAAIIFLFSGYATSSELLSVGILFSLFRFWLPSLMGIPFMRRLIR